MSTRNRDHVVVQVQSSGDVPEHHGWISEEDHFHDLGSWGSEDDVAEASSCFMGNEGGGRIRELVSKEKKGGGEAIRKRNAFEVNEWIFAYYRVGR